MNKTTNNVLWLKNGKFLPKAGGIPGNPNIPKNKFLDIEHLKKLLEDFKELKKFWIEEIQKNTLKIKPIVSIYYNDVIAKSNRMKYFLDSNPLKNNQTIVGIQFNESDKILKHIISHCIELDVLNKAVKNLENVIKISESKFNKRISYQDIENISQNKKENEELFKDFQISQTLYIRILVDAYYIEKVGVKLKNISENLSDNIIVTLYDIGINISDILKDSNIKNHLFPLNNSVITLNLEQYKLLVAKFPYLIAMESENNLKRDELGYSSKKQEQIITIPEPNNEPVVGVIDTHFVENPDDVYFGKWVEYHNKIDKAIPITSKDREHGTAVSYIIVDGPSANKDLEDGCGKFRVRLFGVSKNDSFNTFSILRTIEEVVLSNLDIKVWNLSLGSNLEINPFSISPIASLLDELQAKYDIIFVVAGTNKKDEGTDAVKIGSPADSINSIVVNSVNRQKQSSDFSRKGPSLSFFVKPDISYYGENITVCTALGAKIVDGTSFAAPWITRKVAFLIHILGLPRELAKALIIDSAIGWQKENDSDLHLKGHGVVPIHIQEIIKSKKDEIKFLINSETLGYQTYNHNIYVPISNKTFPFIAKATLAYFSTTSRLQGIDYTNTELDFKFGKLKMNSNKKIEISSINNNKQDYDGTFNLPERKVRELFRKWDNVKNIIEYLKLENNKIKNKAKKYIDNDAWGISVTKKERLNLEEKNSIKFGIVVTLKEIKGQNRWTEFIQLCDYKKSWTVEELNAETSYDLYNMMQKEVEFDN
ncbi:S8 family peptidase [Mycoplasma sp. 1654_15]|nr:S8 family peptidase [Mycoplasma sp. 1654_15]